MSDKVLIVTPPDDIQRDGVRVLLVDLTPDQMKILSDATIQVSGLELPNTIIYMCQSDDTDWLLDKKFKSDLIIFNADSDNDLIIGYLAAQHNSYYFGILKNLNAINRSAIYNTDQAIELLEKLLKQHETY